MALHSLNLPLNHASSDIANAQYANGEDKVKLLDSAAVNITRAKTQVLEEIEAEAKRKASF